LCMFTVLLPFFSFFSSWKSWLVPIALGIAATIVYRYFFLA